MKIAALVIAYVVFAALLVVDTGALLHLVFAWAMSGPAYRSALLYAPIVVALYIWGQKRHRALGRIDRDRGAPFGAAPPTPPGIRVSYHGGSTGLSWDRNVESGEAE